MHFHFYSFLLGLVSGIILVCLIIYLALNISIKIDEDLFGKQRSRDAFEKEDSASRK